MRFRYRNLRNTLSCDRRTGCWFPYHDISCQSSTSEHCQREELLTSVGRDRHFARHESGSIQAKFKPVGSSNRSSASGVVVRPIGGNLYQYSVGSDGKLSALAPASISIGATQRSIVISPNGDYAYVAVLGSNQMRQFSVGANGQLTALSPASVSTGSQPRYFSLGPQGAVGYVSNYIDSTISQFSLSDGKLSPLSPTTVTTGTSPQGTLLISRPQ